ncbi:MAG: GerMN domain-containing protein [Lachnospiraceae bacterium]|nr:GerMN domain-containing protein [Lachnospiraceae bacterium]
MKKVFFAAAVFIFSLLIGCGNRNAGGRNETGMVVYCLDEDCESLEKEEYFLESSGTEEMIGELLDAAASGPLEEGHRKLMPDEVAVKGFTSSGGIVTLDFTAGYLETKKTREVLMRAGLVRTLVQIPGISYVLFTVEGEPIRDRSENEIGLMSADTFIENTGKQINTYQHATINLYFAAEGGKELALESRSIYYSSSKPLEWAIVERLIAGPKLKENYAAIPAGTRIISVTTSENICYVNLTEGFLAEIPGVDRKVTIESIVNSICENGNASLVQFSVGGETDVDFGEGINLAAPFSPEREK